jgi:hypothetical protein
MSDAALHVMLAEYYKMGLNAQANNAMFNQPMPNMAALFGASSLPALQGASTSTGTSSTSNALLKGIPDISITPTRKHDHSFEKYKFLMKNFFLLRQ